MELGLRFPVGYHIDKLTFLHRYCFEGSDFVVELADYFLWRVVSF
jgi:hypothetical protein